MNETPEERHARLYAELLGEEKLAEQRELARTHFACCWEPRESGHHGYCPERPEEEEAGIADGQASLL